MKKMKIRGKELKRIGYSDDRSISLALRITGKHHKRSDKVEILELLEKIHLNPEEFKSDPIWGELAVLFIEKPLPVKKSGIKLNKAAQDFKIYGAENIDPAAIEQMQMAMKLPVTVEGALMADAHVGYGLPIGGVLATYNAVIPYGVGMDIGCRMCMSVFPLSPKQIAGERNRIKNIIMSETRFGLAEFNDLGDYEILERKEFNEIKFLRSLHGKFAKQLGTSGHGNHFVDVGYVEIKQH